MFDFLKKSKVSVSSVNVKWKGSTHSLGKVSSKSSTFEINIPFQNKPQEDYSLFKTQKRPPAVIKGIDVKSPFKLLSSDPVFPITVNESEKITIKAKIEAPQYAYEGPLNVELLSDVADMAHLEISKVVVSTAKKRTELALKPIMMDVVKGQIFKQNIHLHGILEHGAEVNKIEIMPPFVFVGSDPKLPFKIDNNTGYLIDIFIQAPDANYGGPLEIRLA